MWLCFENFLVSNMSWSNNSIELGRELVQLLNSIGNKLHRKLAANRIFGGIVVNPSTLFENVEMSY